MKHGQAPHRWAHPLLALLVALPLLLGLGGAALVWRLSQGPLELGILASLIEAQLNRPDATGRLRIGRVAVAWGGLRGEAPLRLRLQDVTLRGERGEMLAQLPDPAVPGMPNEPSVWLLSAKPPSVVISSQYVLTDWYGQ